MKRFTLFVCLLALFTLAFGLTAQANVYHSVASGNWSAASTWWSGHVPTSSDFIAIGSNDTVTVDINSASCSTLDLGDNSFYPGFGVLVFNPSSQLTINSTFTWGTTTAADSGTIDMTSGGTLILNGAVTVTAAQAHLYAGTGTIEYLGVSPTVAGGTYNNLTINLNSGEAHLGGSSTVNGTLYLGGSIILLDAYNLTLGGTVTGTTSAGSCVVTNGTGVVSRTIANAGSFTFPIGPSDSKYNPVTLNNNTDSTYVYTAQVAVGDNPTTADNTKAGNQTWTLTGSAAGGTGVDLSFTWLTSDAGASVTPASAVAWYYNGSAWVQLGGTTAAGTPNVTTVGGVTSLSSVVIGNPGALPVELASLTAKAIANNVNVTWTTVSETSTLGFYVERGTSKTGPFTAISSLIAGAGTSLAQHNYSYADNNVSSGTYYYRVHEVDKNGAGTYSSVITITVASVLGVREEGGVPTAFKLGQNYPNPFNPTTDIEFSIKDAAFTTLKVYNAIGQEIATLANGMMQPGNYVATWNAGAAPSGVYFYRLLSGSNVSVQRMMMMK